MPDVLTEEERQAIAQFKGKVKKIKRGQSGIPIVTESSKAWSEKYNKKKIERKKNRHEEMRNDQRLGSMTIDEIARKYDVSPATASKDLRALGIKPFGPKRKVRQ